MFTLLCGASGFMKALKGLIKSCVVNFFDKIDKKESSNLPNNHEAFNYQTSPIQNFWKQVNLLFSTKIPSNIKRELTLSTAKILKSDSHLPKKLGFFASKEALYKWWKIIVISS